MLKIVTYNVFLGLKTKEILKWLAKEKVDLICLQEFPENHLAFLKQSFPGHDYEFVTSFRWDRSYGQVTLYKKDAMELVSAKKFGVSKSLKKRIFKYGENRHALLTRFKYKGKGFTLINAHLTPLAVNAKRVKELERILEEVIEEPVILLGDLNYSSLLPRKKLFNLMEKNKFSNATKGFITHKLLGIPQQMDYIFHRNIKLSETKVKVKKFSDHQPVFAEIEFN